MPTHGNYLLGIKLKKTVKIDVKGPILQHIRNTYGDHAAENSKESLDAIQEMRDQIYGAAGSNVGIGMDLFAKYLYAVRAIEMRFPISNEKGHINIPFKWFDSFRDTMATTQRSIHLEKAAVLFCMAAIDSQKGVQGSDRLTEAEIGTTTKALARSASLLGHLRDEVALKIDSPKPVDMSGECLTLLEQLMLAQANEVFYEGLYLKVSSGSSKAFNKATLAAVAHAISRMYDAVAALYHRPQLERHFDKEYGVCCNAKSLLYKCEARFFQAKHHLAKDGLEHGAAIAHLREASALLEGAKRQFQSAPSELQKSYKTLKDMVTKEKDKAEEENRRVYMNVVPDHPPALVVKENLLVKAINPSDLFVRKEEYFSEIVPEAVTKRLSQYTAKLDDVVRGLLARLEAATDDARTVLAQHELPAVLDAMNPNKRELPDKAVAALSDDFIARGPASQLREQSRLLADLKASTMQELQQCKLALDEEERQDREMREKWGGTWTRPHSNVLNAEYRGSIARYEQGLRDAAQSDHRTTEDLNAHGSRIESLSMDSARSMIPVLQAPMVSTGSADPATVTATIRQILGALDGLSAERGGLEERIKAAREKDNVLPELLRIGADGAQQVMERALVGYQSFEKEVDENVNRQAELLGVLHQNMGAFKSLYDVEGWRIEVDRVASSIRDDVLLGAGIVNRLSEGVRYYTELNRAIKKLHEGCQGFLMSRNIDLQERDRELGRMDQRKREAEANEKAAQEFSRLEMSGRSPSSNSSNPAPHPSHSPTPPQPQNSYPQPPPHGYNYPQAPPQQHHQGAPYGPPQQQGYNYPAAPPNNPYPTHHAPQPSYQHAPHPPQYSHQPPTPPGHGPPNPYAPAPGYYYPYQQGSQGGYGQQPSSGHSNQSYPQSYPPGQPPPQ